MDLATLLHPKLRALSPDQRRAALREARRAPLDVIELVAMAAGLIVGSLLARSGAGSLFGGIAFCSLLFGLLLLRRTRRGLRDVLERA